MRKQLITTLATACSFLAMVTTPALADYSNAVVSLNPVAYWPLNETVQPPPAYVATNSGTIGSFGNGYYETWYNPTNNGFNATMSWQGPMPGVTGDGDTAANFSGDANQYIQIPHTFTNTIVKAPFTVECWTYATNTSDWVNLVGDGGQYQQPNNASGSYAGFYLDHYGGSWLFGLYNTNGTGHSVEVNVGGVTPNQWTHLVATYDGTNANLYVNGTLAGTAIASTNALGLGYVPDAVNPIIIGTLGRPHWVNAYNGLIDEVAIYTNLLTPDVVAAHYSLVSGTGYASMVLTSSPSIYLRLGEPAYTLPSSNSFSSFPKAHSYGSIGDAAVGLYQPGTLPGVAGPSGSGFGAANYAVAINGQNAGVDVGNGALTNVAPQLNVTGTNPMSIITWYKANPADVYNRFQNILGHSDSGWRVGFGGTGPRFNPGGGGEIDSSDLYNDSRWHMLAGVYDSVSNYLYLDGKLVKTTPYTGSQNGSVQDVILGGDPQYTTPAGRYFDGRIAQVAFFTNAITAGNVLSLYSNAQIYPFIISQPVSANVNAGTAYTNSVVVGGSPTLSYQWYQNGTAVSGQTNLNLVFTPITGDDAGNYYLVVTNNGGAVTSSVVALSVNTSPQITALSGTNYILFTGGSATLSVAAIGANPVYYYWYSNNVAVAGSTNATSYLLTNASLTTAYTVVASNYLGAVSNIVTVTVEPQPTATYPQAVLAAHPIGYWRMDEADTGYPNTGVPTYDYWGGHNGAYMNTELSQAGYSATPPDPDTAALFGDLVDSDSYAGQIPGIDFGTATGNAELSVEAWVNVPASQLHDGGIITKGTGAGGEQFNLDTGAGSHAFRFFVRDAAGNVHLANSTVVPDGAWHHVVGVCDEVNGSIYLYIDGALAASTTISAGSGLLNSANPVSFGSRQGGASGAYDQQLYGTVDEVAIYNYALSPSQVTSHYYAIGGFAPVITAQPTNITANAGSTVTFSAGVGGSPTLTYQWYDVTGGFPGTAITGETNISLTLTDITSAQNGKLFAIVAANSVSQTTSSAAQLTVVSGPPVLQTDLQPLYAKAFVGLPLTFTVSVGGTPPFHYQWLQNGSPVGPNAATYTLPVIAGTNTYSCTITNASGSISSSTATVVGVAITDTGTNTATSSTTFAVNFMDAANAAYTVDGGNNWTNVLYQGLGAYPDASANTNWNGFGQFPNGYLPSFNSAVAPQVASDGTLTPITFTAVYGFDSGALAYGPPGSGYAGNTAQGDPSLLLGECAVVNGSSTATGSITLSNVPPGTYALYLYAANVNNDRGATFNFTSGSPLGGTNVVINANPGSGPASNFVYGVTYVIYTGVTPDTNGVITGTWGVVSNPNSGNTNEGDFNGLQLVRVSGPTSAPTILTINGSGANVIISWTPTSGTLQSATSLTGPYTDIIGATSPYTNSVSGAQQFFRVKVQ